MEARPYKLAKNKNNKAKINTTIVTSKDRVLKNMVITVTPKLGCPILLV